MVPFLPKMTMPDWLESAATNPSGIHDFPVDEVLLDSVYYPACGFDPTPIYCFEGNAYSFVYVDYAPTRESYLAEMPRMVGRDYDLVYSRDVTHDEVVPRNWRPPILPSREEMERVRLGQSEAQRHLFGHWSIWARKAASPDVDSSLAKYISLFYLCGEMFACYMGLYSYRKIKPKILAILCPGCMGGEWENIRTDNSFFHRVVAANPAGIPEYVLSSSWGVGYGPKVVWSEYEEIPTGDHNSNFDLYFMKRKPNFPSPRSIS